MQTFKKKLPNESRHDINDVLKISQLHDKNSDLAFLKNTFHDKKSRLDYIHQVGCISNNLRLKKT